MRNMNQKGSLLVGLVVGMTIIAGLGAGVAYLMSTSTMGELFQNNQAKAHYLAESGGRYGVPRLAGFSEKSSYTYSMDSGKGKFVLYVYTTSAQYSKFDSTGIVNEGAWSEGKKKLTFEVYSGNPLNPTKRCMCRCQM